jgi:Tfp pilus assembly protein PilF
MKIVRTIPAFCFCCLSWIAAEAQAPDRRPTPESDSRIEALVELNRGVDAFNAGHYDEAEEAFRHAKELDPRLINAQLWLATTYAQRFIPGAPSEENIRHGEKSIEEFRGALIAEPNNLSAIDGWARFCFRWL